MSHADLIEQAILYEGPGNVAAILLESYSGTSGVVQEGAVFWKQIQRICDKYDIVLIIDKVMSGWNRPASEPMRQVASTLRKQGVSTFVKWD